MVNIPSNRTPTHPGEMLLQEFLSPLEITPAGRKPPSYAASALRADWWVGVEENMKSEG